MCKNNNNNTSDGQLLNVNDNFLIPNKNTLIEQLDRVCSGSFSHSMLTYFDSFRPKPAEQTDPESDNLFHGFYL